MLTVSQLNSRGWPRGVTTLDPEASDRGSNPREAFTLAPLGASLISRHPRHELLSSTCYITLPIQKMKQITWPRGVTVSTLDSESSDRASNPREAFTFSLYQCDPRRFCITLSDLWPIQ